MKKKQSQALSASTGKEPSSPNETGIKKVPSRTEQVRPITTNGRPKSPNSKKPPPQGKENLEKEYILNLQQQIYFLGTIFE